MVHFMLSKNSLLWQSPFALSALIFLLFLILYLCINYFAKAISQPTRNKSIHKRSYNKDIPINIPPPHSAYRQTLKNTNSFHYDTFHYYQKKNFMTNRERFFFNLLHSEFHQDFFIFSQVRMVDIIIPIFDKDTQYNSYIKAFRSISQYHIDFLIVDKTNFSIVCAIELDDYSHDLPDRIKRDNKINRIFKFTGITLLRSRKTTELLNKVRYYIRYYDVK